MDVISLSQHGLGYSVATLGTATTTAHLQQVFRHAPEVVFCFDGDAAGRQAADKALHTVLPLMEDGRQARFLFLPDGEDPDSMVRKLGAAEFERRIDQATPLENYLFDSQSAGLDGHSGKARLTTLVTPLIKQLPDGVFKALMMNAVAERSGVARQLLDQQLQSSSNIDTMPDKQQSSPAMDKPRRHREAVHSNTTATNPVLYAIALLLYEPQAALRATHYTADIKSDNDPNMALLLAMLAFLQQTPHATSAALMGHWSHELSAVLQQLPLLDHFVHDCDIEQVFIDTVQHIQQRQQHCQIDRAIHQLGDKPFTQQTEMEKKQLKQLLQRKHLRQNDV